MTTQLRAACSCVRFSSNPIYDMIANASKNRKMNEAIAAYEVLRANDGLDAPLCAAMGIQFIDENRLADAMKVRCSLSVCVDSFRVDSFLVGCIVVGETPALGADCRLARCSLGARAAVALSRCSELYASAL